MDHDPEEDVYEKSFASLAKETDVETAESISSETVAGDSDEYETKPSTKRDQFIWEEDGIWEELHALIGAEEVFRALRKDDPDVDDIDGRAGLLIGAWTGNEKILRMLLEKNTPVNVVDNEGRSPTYLAAYSGTSDCLQLLLEHGAKPSKWDRAFTATPLHCAANKGHLHCLRILLKFGADVNAGVTHKSPLHMAVQSGATECVKELLNAGAIPNTPQVFSEAPIHVAAAHGYHEIIKLLLEHGASVGVQCGPDKSTALHLAVTDGNIESVRLLISAGAQLAATNYKLQTPLHLAALSQSSEMIELLLRKGADPNASDNYGRTPLHCAIVKLSRSSKPLRALLNAGANANKPDSYGYTPLHLAALNEFSQYVMLLLSYGADFTAKTNGGVSALTFVTRRTPDVIRKYISKLDASINVNDHEIGDVDCELKLDFRILVPPVAKGETDLLVNFIQVGHREILKHPLCETFLHLKWQRIRKFFIFSVFYHFLFATLFSVYTVEVFGKYCSQMKPNSSQLETTQEPCTIRRYSVFVGWMLIILNCALLLKEGFQFVHSWKMYIKDWENWLESVIIFDVFCTFLSGDNFLFKCSLCQHKVAAIGIFLTWFEFMMLVGRFPQFGSYIHMFTTVSFNFFKFFLAYIWLLIAFALSFQIVFSEYKAFKRPMWTVLKTIVMMSGELEYEDMFYPGDELVQYLFPSYVMFLVFVILITIIMTNLMVGLAVSDIQGLQRSAGLNRLVRQAKLVARFESMLFSKLLYCMPKPVLIFFYRHALLLNLEHNWAVYIKPNDPRESKIPRELIKNVYKIVATKKCRSVRKCRRSDRSDKSTCKSRKLGQPSWRTNSISTISYNFKV